MAERLNQCPKCGKYQYTDIVVKAHNPDTTDMNMRATLRCQHEGCGHEWEGKVTSPHHERQRQRGWVI
tara:strand:+ start:113 stop:316 length:204 start_codon:yes stop_codon:yes gene_type:complete